MQRKVLAALLAVLLTGCTSGKISVREEPLSGPAAPSKASAQGGPTSTQAGPTPAKGGPTSTQAGPTPAKGGPTSTQAGPTPTRAVPAPAPGQPAPSGLDHLQVLDASWSPDGRSVALLTESGLHILNPSSQTLTTWPLDYERGMTLAGWEYDGRAVYVVTPAFGLIERGPTAREGADLYPPAFEPPPYEAWYKPSPKGPQVARYSTNGAFKLLGEYGTWNGNFMNWSPTGRYFAWTDDQSLHVVDIIAKTGWASGNAAYPQWHPGGEKYLTVTNTGMEVRSLKGDALVRVPGVRAADWSAAGDRIVYQDQTGVWTIDADGENRQQLLAAPIEGLQRMVWLAQDEIVFCAVGKGGGGGIRFSIGLITGGKSTVLAENARSDIRISPDKKRVIYLVGSPAGNTPADLYFYPAQ